MFLMTLLSFEDCFFKLSLEEVHCVLELCSVEGSHSAAFTLHVLYGAAVAQWVEQVVYQSEGRWFDPRVYMLKCPWARY